ncbi:MAG: HipA N-terminal domain-containing protein [Desulfobacteraceae bacterium]|nr:HipA N-terminal domain-containing protein [Desulfobacteraceae bacterium]
MHVFFEQTRVGSLSIDKRRRFSFIYSREWLDSPETFQISISLPLQAGVFQHDTVKSFFSNLLPESAVRTLISKQLGISEKNDFMLLKRIGGECAGAISILPETEKPESPGQYKYRSLSDRQFSDLITRMATLKSPTCGHLFSPTPEFRFQLLITGKCLNSNVSFFLHPL